MVKKKYESKVVISVEQCAGEPAQAKIKFDGKWSPAMIVELQKKLDAELHRIAVEFTTERMVTHAKR